MSVSVFLCVVHWYWLMQGFIGEKLLKKLESWAKAFAVPSLSLSLSIGVWFSAVHWTRVHCFRGRTYVKHATYDQVVPREMYVRVVKRIKRKYNTEWLEKWKTRTDTTKHVYEDINTGLSPRLHILFSIH